MRGTLIASVESLFRLIMYTCRSYCCLDLRFPKMHKPEIYIYVFCALSQTALRTLQFSSMTAQHGVWLSPVPVGVVLVDLTEARREPRFNSSWCLASTCLVRSQPERCRQLPRRLQSAGT